jgi:hypothetical protein
MMIPDGKIESVVSDDSNRLSLTQIKLDVVKKTEADHTYSEGYLTATDGTMLAKVKVSLDEGDTAGLVSPAVLKHARKVKPTHKGAPKSVQLNGEARFQDGSTMPRAEFTEVNFPDTESVIESAKQRKDTGVIVALDTALLHTLAQAICNNGCTIVKIHIPKGADSAMMILPYTANDNEGLLMPCVISR